MSSFLKTCARFELDFDIKGLNMWINSQFQTSTSNLPLTIFPAIKTATQPHHFHPRYIRNTPENKLGRETVKFN